MTNPPPPQNLSQASVPGWLRPGWPLYIALVVLLGLYQGLNELIGMRHSAEPIAVWKPFVWELSSVLVILALIPYIVRLERRSPTHSRPRSRVLAVHAAGILSFSLVHTAGMIGLRKLVYAMAGEHYEIDAPVQALYELQKDAITYLIILVVIFAVRQFRIRRTGELRATELAAELDRARLQHLTAQIEPHFLFNSLNAISNRMHEDVEAADRMISRLGDLLRAAYDGGGHVLVPLERELQWLRSYAAMMAERYRNQLHIDIVVAEGLTHLDVPRLLLQPVVENALRHGLAEGQGRLIVDIRRIGRHLNCTVRDDGAGLTEIPPVMGTGLANVSRRLELMFPGDHQFSLARGTTQGTVVTLIFPVSD